MLQAKLKYYVGNPDFNEVLFFFGLHADSFQMKHKRRKQQEKMKKVLLKLAPHFPNFPYTEPLMVSIGISGHIKDYRKRDIDNMVKTILDAMKKIAFVDDRLIHILLVQKQMWDINPFGFMVGLRPISGEKPDKYSPLLTLSYDNSLDIREHSKKIQFINFSNDSWGPTVMHSEDGDIVQVAILSK